MIQIHAQVYGIYTVISITPYVYPVLLLKLYFKKDDKSTSDSLRLNSATVLDDTTDSGKPLKQLAHLLKSQNANSWVRQNGCIKTNRLRQDSVHLVLECRKVTVG